MQVHYRQLMIEDKHPLLQLFERVPPSIARMSNRFVYKAIVDDALSSKYVAIIIVLLDNCLVGYVIVTWDWNYFKRMFILRHPLLGFAALIKRLKIKGKTHDSSSNSLKRTYMDTLSKAWNTKQLYAWEDSAKTIGKIIQIGIDSQVRLRGLGRGLLTNLISHLSQQGITRIDAHINKDNIASYNMFKKAGWTVIEDSSGYFSFYEIGSEGLRSNG